MAWQIVLKMQSSNTSKNTPRNLWCVWWQRLLMLFLHEISRTENYDNAYFDIPLFVLKKYIFSLAMGFNDIILSIAMTLIFILTLILLWNMNLCILAKTIENLSLWENVSLFWRCVLLLVVLLARWFCICFKHVMYLLHKITKWL